MSMFFSDIGHMHLFFIFSPKKMRDYGTFFPFIFHMSNLSVFCGHYAFVFLHMSIYSNFCGHYAFVFLHMSIYSNFCGHYSFIFCICPFARPQKNQELSLLIFLYNNHLISAKNSRSILFGKYSGEDPAAIPHTSFNPYFFAICFARNT